MDEISDTNMIELPDDTPVSIRPGDPLCDTHRHYRAKRRPKVQCKQCWDAFYAKHPEKEPEFRAPMPD
jgi:hypothetical protein